MKTEVARKADGGTERKSRKRPPGRPRGLRISVTAPEHLLACKSRLGLSDAVLTYRDAAAELTKHTGVRVGPGTVFKFAHGDEPQRASLRRVFGLPPIVVSHEIVCAGCGGLHKRVARCPNAPKPTSPAWVSVAATWLAGHECLTPPAVRVYGRRGKAVTW